MLNPVYISTRGDALVLAENADKAIRGVKADHSAQIHNFDGWIISQDFFGLLDPVAV